MKNNNYNIGTGNSVQEDKNKEKFKTLIQQQEKFKSFTRIINGLLYGDKNGRTEEAKSGLVKIIYDQKEDIKEYRKDQKDQASKSIETIGLFSAILALLIIDVNIIKSADSFLAAILLIVALTCSMAIFAVLIHSFFSPDEKEKFGKMPFQLPMAILIGLILVGTICYYKNLDLYHLENENQKVNINQTQIDLVNK